MPTKLLVTCFSDLKGSTGLTEELGHQVFGPHRDEHLEVGRTLAEASGGEYIKSIGDAHMVTFEYLEDALRFAVCLQEFYKPRPCFRQGVQLKVRIGIFLGAVEALSGDVFGSGVNQAARVEGLTEPGEVQINKALYDNLAVALGKPRAEKYFRSKGEFELKGITSPPKQELLVFDWEQYAHDVPQASLAKQVEEQLLGGGTEISNLDFKDFATPGLIIWPVVPRDLTTAIHRGQIEIIRLLVQLGWEVCLLIANCGAQRSFDLSYSTAFWNKSEKHLHHRDIVNVKPEYMSRLYDPNHTNYTRIQAIFREVTSKITLQDLLEINYKNYSPEEKSAIHDKSATLDFLRPALSIAAVLYLAEEAGRKSIVLVGFDEAKQWRRAYDLPGTNERLGVLMNPILNLDEKFQSRQTGNWPSWFSRQELIRDMMSNNLAWWVYSLHAYIPAFPAKSVEIDGQNIAPEDWTDVNKIDLPAQLSREALAEHVWQFLNPSL